ncbi:MAG: Hpt domain-containing protein [Oscillospiraceae bacterium]|nr:Hpt domain-containing protein [Oscillospiraceae bacterium]
MFNPNELIALGINLDEALERFMGKQSIYDKMLKKLPKAIEQYQVLECFLEGDYEKAVANAHTLKGATGNLSVTPLFTAYTEIVDNLRANNPQAAQAILEEILPVQEKIVAYIEENAD